MDDLLLARRGTAYFARLFNDLPDDALVSKSRVSGRSRAHIIAHIGYHARGLTRLMEGARTGIETPEYANNDAQIAEVVLGASLPARALRGLFQHAAVHLDVEWRDLPEAAWNAHLSRLDGTRITARDTPLIRARVIWQAAHDLDAGGRVTDIPALLRGEAGLK